ncbi:MAG: Zn-dependent exopeptidase M28 [Deltaproteobacteria bacterium]|nr:Zn-dependent exopeptidase M28 [Deltaproteobacteria bacterium]
MKLAALLLALAACDGSSMDSPDAGTDGAVGSDAPPGCTRPAIDATWLQSQLTSWVAGLASAPRATSTQRTTARTYLMNQLATIGWTAQLHMYTTGANVHVTIPATMGTGKEILVGAHFDTVTNSPGANDNASGVAVVLAVARYLVDVPCRTAPVTIVLFDGEENGLLGSRAYAPTKTAANVRAVHTIDQVAWDQDNDLRFELEAPTPTLEAEYRAAAQVVGALVTTVPTEGTDHQAFRERGFAAIGLTEEYVGGDTSPHRHLAGDTPATVDT